MESVKRIVQMTEGMAVGSIGGPDTNPLPAPGRVWRPSYRVFLQGGAMTRFGKRPESLLGIARAATDSLLAATDARPDYLLVSNFNAEQFCGLSNLPLRIASHQGLPSLPGARVEATSASGGAAVQQGAALIGAGLAQQVLVVGVEKMTHVPTATATAILGQVLHPSEVAAGLSMPAVAAVATRLWLTTVPGASMAALSAVATKNHANAVHNPFAHFQTALGPQDLASSPLVAEPLRRHDCAPLSDGAATLLLGADSSDVEVVGMGAASQPLALADRPSPLEGKATAVAGGAALAQAGREASQVEVAEIHDAFTILELLSLEDLGLLPKGTAHEATLEGITSIDGRLPTNPSGGLKARGHPIGASGVAQVIEVAAQLRGECGGRQVGKGRRPNLGLAHAIGGFGAASTVTLLARR